MSDRRSSETVAATNAIVLFHQEYLGTIEQRQVVDVPEASSAIMLGPHPDDIVLGCGGTAIKYAERGIPVHFLCLTDGRACVADAEERQRMVEIRAEEERAAGRICGVASVDLMAFPEDEFTHPQHVAHLASEIATRIRGVAADAVYVPYWFEAHPWHRYTNFLLAEALKSVEFSGRILAYEVLSLVPPSVVVDISEVIERKKDAVRAYASQMALRDYVHDMMMIDSMHAPLAGPQSQVAEVFQVFTKDEFIGRVGVLGPEAPGSMSCGIQPVIPES